MSIKHKVTRAFARQAFKIKTNTPHIMFAGGIIGVLGGTVLACRATLRIEPVLDEVKEEIDAVKTGLTDTEGYQKDLAYVYAKSAIKVAEVYAPAIAVGGLSLVALTGAHIQLSRRNTALTVAYTGLHHAYNEYRNRVREAVGKDKELDLYFGATNETVEDDKGKKHQVKVVDPNKLSPYARFFDEASVNWQKDPEINRLFVQCRQNFANNLLVSRGHLFLNEVYDMLGIDRSSAGQVVGWVINDNGDNFVDFGIFEAHSAPFVNGYERSILLDFNVDGVVVDKI